MKQKDTFVFAEPERKARLRRPALQCHQSPGDDASQREEARISLTNLVEQYEDSYGEILLPKADGE